MATIMERLADLSSGVFLRSADVTDVVRLSERFVKIELRSDSFRRTSWTPGAKLQFRPQRGTFGVRTYTPIMWDGIVGSTELVAFTHGDGPAAEWFRGVEVGDGCEVYGPRKSIDLTELSNPVVFVGDESTVGLACALQSSAPVATVRYVFEATDSDELVGVLGTLGLAETSVTVPKTDDRGLVCSAARAAAVEFDRFDLVLAGDAATIGALRRNVRQWPRPADRTKVKTYWAKGRTGLD